MKAASADLIALLASDAPIVMWEVYTVTLVDGTVLTWTSDDVPGAVDAGTRGTESSVALTG